MNPKKRMNLDEPLWDQSTFTGRFKYYLWMTDFRTVMESDENLDNAKLLLQQYRKGEEPPGTTTEQIIYARKLYESAFHPDTGDKQNVFGRMSFQVPGGMAITGAMLQFYRTIPAVIFWQWINQSFNALVNYTNRNAKSPISTTQLGLAYVSATVSAMVAAIGFKSYWSKNAGPFIQRYVPFAAVAAANCVNIPLMRQTELLQGIDVTDEHKEVMCSSQLAAMKGISQVVFCRIVMAAPGMLITPLVMARMEQIDWFKRMKFLHAPFQTFGAGFFLVFMVPFACAIFPQRCSISSSTIAMVEPLEYKKMKEKAGCVSAIPDRLYFNKGL